MAHQSPRRPLFVHLTPDQIEPGHVFEHDPYCDGPEGKQFCWCGWDEESHSTYTLGE